MTYWTKEEEQLILPEGKTIFIENITLIDSPQLPEDLEVCVLHECSSGSIVVARKLSTGIVDSNIKGKELIRLHKHFYSYEIEGASYIGFYLKHVGIEGPMDIQFEFEYQIIDRPSIAIEEEEYNEDELQRFDEGTLD